MNDKKILNDFVVIKAIEDSVNVIGLTRRNLHQVSPLRKTGLRRGDDRTIHGAYLGN